MNYYPRTGHLTLEEGYCRGYLHQMKVATMLFRQKLAQIYSNPKFYPNIEVSLHCISQLVENGRPWSV